MDKTEEIVNKEILQQKEIDINLSNSEEIEDSDLSWDDIIPRKNEAYDMLEKTINIVAAMETLYEPIMKKNKEFKEKFIGFVNSVNELSNKFIDNVNLHSLPRKSENEPLVFKTGKIQNDENGFANTTAVLNICNTYVMISVGIAELNAKVLPIIFSDVNNIINNSNDDNEEIKSILENLKELDAFSESIDIIKNMEGNKPNGEQ